MSGSFGCSTYGSFEASNWRDRCGVWRWPVKTTSDSAASDIDETPVSTTVANLLTLTPPAGLTGRSGDLVRQAPTEQTVYRLTNVHVSEIGQARDSDYHLVVSDAPGEPSMGAEVPFPGCVATSSPLGCNVTHARAAVDAQYPGVDSFMTTSTTATIIGVGFFDFVHTEPGSTGSQAPNGMELHPVVAICFGVDCDPLADL